MKRILISIFVIVLGSFLVSAQDDKGGSTDDALKIITKDLLKEYLSYLASDELKGRGTGTEGNTKATEYIAAIYEKAGLKPAGDKDDKGTKTFYQHFKVSDEKTRNTIAYLEGSDPNLKDEVVIIGGHHDHLGVKKLGKGKDGIFNGADDNASGTCGVIAIAKAFGQANVKTKRTIVFMTFSGEELGLLGSEHYVENPIFPLKNTVAMINLDMIGRQSKDKVDLYGLGTEKGEVFENIVKEAVKKTELSVNMIQTPDLRAGDSDHSSFKRKKIPVMFFFTDFHADYHQPSDHAEKIEYEKMEKIVKTAFLITYQVAQLDERPKYGVPTPKSSPRLLGILSDAATDEERDELGLEGEQGALKITEVREGGVAEKYKFQEGDYIITVNGKTLSRNDPLSELKEILSQVKPKKDVPIEIVRDGKKKTIKVRWDR